MMIYVYRSYDNRRYSLMTVSEISRSFFKRLGNNNLYVVTDIPLIEIDLLKGDLIVLHGQFRSIWKDYTGEVFNKKITNYYLVDRCHLVNRCQRHQTKFAKLIHSKDWNRKMLVNLMLGGFDAEFDEDLKKQIDGLRPKRVQEEPIFEITPLIF